MHVQPAAAPGALADHTATGHTAVPLAGYAAYTRPGSGLPPTDGQPAAPPATGAPAEPPPGDPTGTPPAVPPTPPAPPPAPVPPTPPPAPPGPPDPPPPPVAERPLDQFPPEIRDHIAELRREAAENRVKAKTAEEAANAQMKQWIDGIAKTFGLVDDGPPPADVTPEQQVARLTEQLNTREADWRASQVELAIWRTAPAHGGDPRRLTDSKAFGKAVAGLDPNAADFDAQLTAAIGAAVANDSGLKAAGKTPPPPPPPPPPVPSSGDFSGGPGGQATTLTTVDDFRAAFRKEKATR